MKSEASRSFISSGSGFLQEKTILRKNVKKNAIIVFFFALGNSLFFFFDFWFTYQWLIEKKAKYFYILGSILLVFTIVFIISILQRNTIFFIVMSIIYLLSGGCSLIFCFFMLICQKGNDTMNQYFGIGFGVLDLTLNVIMFIFINEYAKLLKEYNEFYQDRKHEGFINSLAHFDPRYETEEEILIDDSKNEKVNDL